MRIQKALVPVFLTLLACMAIAATSASAKAPKLVLRESKSGHVLPTGATIEVVYSTLGCLFETHMVVEKNLATTDKLGAPGETYVPACPFEVKIENVLTSITLSASGARFTMNPKMVFSGVVPCFYELGKVTSSGPPEFGEEAYIEAAGSGTFKLNKKESSKTFGCEHSFSEEFEVHILAYGELVS